MSLIRQSMLVVRFVRVASIAAVLAAAGLIRPIPATADDTVCGPFPPAPRMLVSQVPLSGTNVETGERLPLGSRIVLMDLTNPPRMIADLTKDFTAAGRPDVSFDGERILFVGRRRDADPQGIYEIGERGKIREVLRSDVDCLTAVYLSSIYTLGAEAPQPLIAFVQKTPDWNTEQIFTCHSDGTNVRRITFNPYGTTGPQIIDDGRLIYTSGLAPLSDKGKTTNPACTMCMFPDGADMQLFAPARSPRVSLGEHCEIGAHRIACVQRSNESSVAAPDLLAITPICRSLHPDKRATATTAPLVSLLSPAAWPDGQIVVSGRTQDQQTWAIYLLSADGASPPRLLYDAPEWHDITARPLVKRRTPHGRSSVVKDTTAAGRLYGIDIYLSDTQAAKTITRGDAKRLRIIQAIAPGATTTGTPSTAMQTREMVIGDAPIESDGSFSLVVPAAVPLRLETLDADGKTLQAMRNWLWVMPNESRGCVGCHADPELSPPNRHPIALWKEPHCIGGAVPPEVEDAHRKRFPTPDREYSRP